MQPENPQGFEKDSDQFIKFVTNGKTTPEQEAFLRQLKAEVEQLYYQAQAGEEIEDE